MKPGPFSRQTALWACAGVFAAAAVGLAAWGRFGDASSSHLAEVDVPVQVVEGPKTATRKTAHPAVQPAPTSPPAPSPPAAVPPAAGLPSPPAAAAPLPVSAPAPVAAPPAAVPPAASPPTTVPSPAGSPPGLIVTEPEPGLPAPTDPAPPHHAPLSGERPFAPPRPEAPPAYDGAPPWRVNAVPAKIPAGRPIVAVVIDDMGLDRKRSARTVRLPGPLTLSWLPYAEDLPAQTAAARAAGHELMVHLPMEPSVPANPGPDPLLTGLDAAENLRRLDRALDRFPGFVGVNNHMGSRFTADAAALRPILAEIKRRGYFWLDSRTAPKSQGMATAADLGMPWAGRDVFLDHVMSAGEVAKSLARLEAVAKQTGAAVAIGHPHDVTIDALTRWLPELPSRGLTLVPMSALVAARQGAAKSAADSAPRKQTENLKQTGEAR